NDPADVDLIPAPDAQLEPDHVGFVGFRSRTPGDLALVTAESPWRRVSIPSPVSIARAGRMLVARTFRDRLSGLQDGSSRRVPSQEQRHQVLDGHEFQQFPSQLTQGLGRLLSAEV